MVAAGRSRWRAGRRASVLSYLVRLTKPLLGRSDDLPGWWTEVAPNGDPSPDFPGGHGNFGMAHGISASLALLSLALLRGVVVDGHTDAIAQIYTWLDTWQQQHPAGPWWPGIITLNDVHTDLAAELPRLAARLLTQFRSSPEDTEFLDGHAGVALALHTAGTDTAPRTGWDACLLLT